MVFLVIRMNPTWIHGRYDYLYYAIEYNATFVLIVYPLCLLLKGLVIFVAILILVNDSNTKDHTQNQNQIPPGSQLRPMNFPNNSQIIQAPPFNQHNNPVPSQNSAYGLNFGQNPNLAIEQTVTYPYPQNQNAQFGQNFNPTLNPAFNNNNPNPMMYAQNPNLGPGHSQVNLSAQNTNLAFGVNNNSAIAKPPHSPYSINFGIAFEQNQGPSSAPSQTYDQNNEPPEYKYLEKQ